ncbi:c-type cytochrome [Paludibacterium purpuratum]|uniref:Cytochrome c n=1 Tax=Paludibacterium purpuratum TaxID=1144873 RepID=A0A4R7B087_9NEIS|nr:c-type cytochrome [Paludibacterium purpuratum]TDR72465.1 cytochrome c [Paludibacterium purpuratum]
MMKKILLASVLSGALIAPAMADIKPMATKDGCFACHTIDTKLVGPAWKDVAKKYKGDKTAEAKLIAKVKNGGSGVWGQVPMPPNSMVSDADVKTLVKGILALK